MSTRLPIGWMSASLLVTLLAAPGSARADDENAAPADEEAQQEPAAPGAGETIEERGEAASGNDRAAAESLRQLGTSLMDLGRLDQACPKLAQSLRAAPNGVVAVTLARCHEQQGKVASAWAEYRQAAAMLRSEGDVTGAERASSRSAELEERLSKLTIVPSEALPGMEVWHDGVRYSGGIFGVPVAVDPGKHHIEVRAHGYRSFVIDVDIAERGDRKIVAVPPLAPETPAGQTAAPARAKPSPPRTHARSGVFEAAAITTTVGVAGLGIGAILGLSAARDVRTAQANPQLCGNAGVCTADGYALIERADDKAVGSTVAFAIGGVALAAGIGMFVIDSVWGSPEEPAATGRAAAWIGLGSAGASLRF